MTLFFETFEYDLNPAFQWYCPPAKWETGCGALRLWTDAKTDFWCRTHYGFTVDNGHFLFAEMDTDFTMTTHLRFYPKHQYDQAGLMVRVSPSCWLKTSVEYEPEGAGNLGVVVTNYGYSDWSTQSFPPNVNELTLKIRRTASDYIVDYLDGRRWSQLRMAHLHSGDGSPPIQAGIYACSPIEAGFLAEFSYITFE